jgi:hypothetical protein
VFYILLEKNIEYIRSKKLKLNSFIFDGLCNIIIKRLKKSLEHIPLIFYQTLEKKNYNGCRIKKKKRQRRHTQFTKLKKVKLV